ncbi:DUF5997 family protein [Streptomyces niveus]
MTSHQTTQTMKPATAAKKLGVYLEATPADFQEGVVSRSELNALQADPPEWLLELRRDGPHPRPVVAAKLGVSISGQPFERGGARCCRSAYGAAAAGRRGSGAGRGGAGGRGRGGDDTGPSVPVRDRVLGGAQDRTPRLGAVGIRLTAG